MQDLMVRPCLWDSETWACLPDPVRLSGPWPCPCGVLAVPRVEPKGCSLRLGSFVAVTKSAQGKWGLVFDLLEMILERVMRRQWEPAEVWGTGWHTPCPLLSSCGHWALWARDSLGWLSARWGVGPGCGMGTGTALHLLTCAVVSSRSPHPYPGSPRWSSEQLALAWQTGAWISVPPSKSPSPTPRVPGSPQFCLPRKGPRAPLAASGSAHGPSRGLAAAWSHRLWPHCVLTTGWWVCMVPL